MASNTDFVQYIVDQCSGAGEIAVKKMMGDYCIYCDGILFGLICDSNLYVKVTEPGKAILKEVMLRPPYDGAKDYFYIDDVDDRDYLKALIKATIPALSKPKAKKHRYLIETPRMRFRPWTEGDAGVLFKYASDPEVGPRAGWQPHKSEEESLKIIRDVFSNGQTWALELKETGEPIGCMGYFTCKESNIGIGENDAELGYWIARPYWNNGLCTEALQAMIDYCFNRKGFKTLWSDFFIDNPASGRVMEKCGFKDTGRVNWCSYLYRGDEQPVRIMRLDGAVG